MRPEHTDILKKALADSFSLREQYAQFYSNTKIALLQMQLQFFQTLGGVSLALLGLGVGTELIAVGIWSLISISLAVILLIYISTLSREIIDNQDRSLDSTDKMLADKQSEIQAKVLEAFEKADSAIFFSYAQQESDKLKEKRDPSPQQIGEVVLFVFFGVIFSGILAITQIPFSFLYLGLLTTLSFVLCFKSWSLRLTELLSKRVGSFPKTKKN